MNGAIICWRNPLENRPDYEEFDSMDDALTALESWKIEYPWNTYTVASVTLIHGATRKWEPLYRYEVIQQVGGIADAAGEEPK